MEKYKTIWDKEHRTKGTAMKSKRNDCPSCDIGDCWFVEWEDGMRTNPCINEIVELPNGELQIINHK